MRVTEYHSWSELCRLSWTAAYNTYADTLLCMHTCIDCEKVTLFARLLQETVHDACLHVVRWLGFHCAIQGYPDIQVSTQEASSENAVRRKINGV